MSRYKKLKPIGEYIVDKEEMIEQVFASIPMLEVRNMVPIKLQGMPLHELKAECMVELLAMSDREILDILEGRKVRDAESSESGSETVFVISDEEKRIKKEKKDLKASKAVLDDRSSAERSSSSKKKKKKKRVKKEVDDKAEPKSKRKKRQKGKEDEAIPSSSKDTKTSTASSSGKKKNSSIEGKANKPIDDDVMILEEISSDEGEVVKEKVQEKSLLDLLELEMRARAIRSLLKKEDDVRAQKILSEYQDEPDDLIPVIEEHPKIEILSDSDDEPKIAPSNVCISMRLDGNNLCSKDADVLDSLLGIGEKVHAVDNLASRGDISPVRILDDESVNINSGESMSPKVSSDCRSNQSNDVPVVSAESRPAEEKRNEDAQPISKDSLAIKEEPPEEDEPKELTPTPQESTNIPTAVIKAEVPSEGVEDASMEKSHERSINQDQGPCKNDVSTNGKPSADDVQVPKPILFPIKMEPCSPERNGEKNGSPAAESKAAECEESGKITDESSITQKISCAPQDLTENSPDQGEGGAAGVELSKTINNVCDDTLLKTKSEHQSEPAVNELASISDNGDALDDAKAQQLSEEDESMSNSADFPEKSSNDQPEKADPSKSHENNETSIVAVNSSVEETENNSENFSGEQLPDQSEQLDKSETSNAGDDSISTTSEQGNSPEIQSDSHFLEVSDGSPGRTEKISGEKEDEIFLGEPSTHDYEEPTHRKSARNEESVILANVDPPDGSTDSQSETQDVAANQTISGNHFLGVTEGSVDTDVCGSKSLNTTSCNVVEIPSFAEPSVNELVSILPTTCFDLSAGDDDVAVSSQFDDEALDYDDGYISLIPDDQTSRAEIEDVQNDNVETSLFSSERRDDSPKCRQNCSIDMNQIDPPSQPPSPAIDPVSAGAHLILSEDSCTHREVCEDLMVSRAGSKIPSQPGSPACGTQRMLEDPSKLITGHGKSGDLSRRDDFFELGPDENVSIENNRRKLDCIDLISEGDDDIVGTLNALDESAGVSTVDQSEKVIGAIASTAGSLNVSRSSTHQQAEQRSSFIDLSCDEECAVKKGPGISFPEQFSKEALTDLVGCKGDDDETVSPLTTNSGDHQDGIECQGNSNLGCIDLVSDDEGGNDIKVPSAGGVERSSFDEAHSLNLEDDREKRGVPEEECENIRSEVDAPLSDAPVTDSTNPIAGSTPKSQQVFEVSNTYGCISLMSDDDDESNPKRDEPDPPGDIIIPEQQFSPVDATNDATSRRSEQESEVGRNTATTDVPRMQNEKLNCIDLMSDDEGESNVYICRVENRDENATEKTMLHSDQFSTEHGMEDTKARLSEIDGRKTKNVDIPLSRSESNKCIDLMSDEEDSHPNYCPSPQHRDESVSDKLESLSSKQCPPQHDKDDRTSKLAEVDCEKKETPEALMARGESVSCIDLMSDEERDSHSIDGRSKHPEETLLDRTLSLSSQQMTPQCDSVNVASPAAETVRRKTEILQVHVARSESVSCIDLMSDEEQDLQSIDSKSKHPNDELLDKSSIGDGDHVSPQLAVEDTTPEQDGLTTATNCPMARNENCIDLMSDDEQEPHSKKRPVDHFSNKADTASSPPGLKAGERATAQNVIKTCIEDNCIDLMSDEELPGAIEIKNTVQSSCISLKQSGPDGSGQNSEPQCATSFEDQQKDNPTDDPQSEIPNTAEEVDELEEGEIVDDGSDDVPERVFSVSDSDSSCSRSLYSYCSTCDESSSSRSFSSYESYRRSRRRKNAERVVARKTQHRKPRPARQRSSSEEVRPKNLEPAPCRKELTAKTPVQENQLLLNENKQPDFSEITTTISKSLRGSSEKGKGSLNPELSATETITIEDDDDDEQSPDKEVAMEIVDLDEEDNQKSNWTARWLDSNNVKKALQTSKILATVRKKLKMKLKSKNEEEPVRKEVPKPSEPLQLIGSVEEYQQLIKDGTIISSLTASELNRDPTTADHNAEAPRGKPDDSAELATESCRAAEVGIQQAVEDQAEQRESSINPNLDNHHEPIVLAVHSPTTTPMITEQSNCQTEALSVKHTDSDESTAILLNSSKNISVSDNESSLSKNVNPPVCAVTEASPDQPKESTVAEIKSSKNSITSSIQAPSQCPAVVNRAAEESDADIPEPNRDTSVVVDQEAKEDPSSKSTLDLFHSLRLPFKPGDIQKLVASGNNCILVLAPSSSKSSNSAPTVVTIAKIDESPLEQPPCPLPLFSLLDGKGATLIKDTESGDCSKEPRDHRSTKPTKDVLPPEVNTASAPTTPGGSVANVPSVSTLLSEATPDTPQNQPLPTPNVISTVVTPMQPPAEFSPIEQYHAAQASKYAEAQAAANSSQQMHAAYHSWLASQGYQGLNSNYGYGVETPVPPSPIVYKQWEEYYRKMMEACQEGAARASAHTMFCPPSSLADEQAKKSYSWVFEHPQHGPTQDAADTMHLVTTPEMAVANCPPAQLSSQRGCPRRGRGRSRGRVRRCRIGLSSSLKESFVSTAHLNCVSKPGNR